MLEGHAKLSLKRYTDLLYMSPRHFKKAVKGIVLRLIQSHR